jgi:hypothetical protein
LFFSLACSTSFFKYLLSTHAYIHIITHVYA